MARTKQIAIRRPPSGWAPSNTSAENSNKVGQPAKSNSKQKGTSPLPTVREIPDALIDFLSHDEVCSFPITKISFLVLPLGGF
jgi:hypothetical protein